MNIRKLIPIFGGAAFIPSSEYSLVLSRATSDGDTQPPLEQKIKQNTLISGLASDGDLAEMDIFYMLSSQADEGFSKINWAAPSTYKLTSLNDVEWYNNIGSRCETSTNAGGYSTGYNPGSVVSKFLRNNNCFGVWVDDPDTKASRGALGVHLVNTSGQGYQLNPRFETSGGADNVIQGQNNNGTKTNVGTGQSNPVGLITCERTASGSYDVKKNGVLVANVTATSQTIVDLTMYICGVSTYPFGQGAAQIYSIPYTGMVRCAFAGSGSINSLDVYNRLNTYFTDPYAFTISSFPSPLEVDILAGQSNACGRGDMADLSKALQAPLDSKVSIFNYSENRFEKIQAAINNGGDPSDVVYPGFHGPEITYLQSFVDVGRSRGLIKYAVPATWLANKVDPTLTWSPDNNDSGNLFDALVTRILAAKAARSITIKSLIWYQGEYDGLTINQNDANAYQANLTAFISALKTAISEPNLKVVLVKVHSNITEVLFAGDFNYTPTVRAADDAVAAADPTNIFTVDSDPYDPTLLHPESAGLQSLGIDIYNITKDF